MHFNNKLPNYAFTNIVIACNALIAIYSLLQFV